MSSDLVNIQAFENAKPAQSLRALDTQSESLADGIGSSYGIVGYRGKVWTLRYRGETKTFVRPDDGSQAPYLDVVVLRSPGYKSKSYYPPGSFEQGSNEAPKCASLDGITPDPDVKERQAAACAICQKNAWKQDHNGRKSRDCADYKRLAVLILPVQSKLLFGAPLIEPVFLRVPAASLNDLSILGETMQKRGYHFSQFVTRIGFHMDKAHPQMTFKALQPITDDTAGKTIMELRENPTSYRITGESEVGKPQSNNGVSRLVNGNGNGSTQPQPTGAPSTLQSLQQNSPASPSSTSSTSSGPSTGAEDDEEAAMLAQLAALRAKKAASQKAAEIIPPNVNANPVQTDAGLGLGDTQPVVEVGPDDWGSTTQKQVAQPVVNTEDDTGPAEDADSALDARVAGLLLS